MKYDIKKSRLVAIGRGFLILALASLALPVLRFMMEDNRSIWDIVSPVINSFIFLYMANVFMKGRFPFSASSVFLIEVDELGIKRGSRNISWNNIDWDKSILNDRKVIIIQRNKEWADKIKFCPRNFESDLLDLLKSKNPNNTMPPTAQKRG